MQSETVRFDESSRCSLSDNPPGPGGVAQAIRQATESVGLDATSELYNEAIQFANDGHLRHARERLQILLGLCPEDGEARLLMAKVYVAGQRWRDALGALDSAQSCGALVPTELRKAVEDNLRAEMAGDEERLHTLYAREQGELKALRQEARRLRSENAQLLGRNYDLEKEARRWAWTTAGVSGVAILFVAVNLLFGGATPTTLPPVAATAPVEAGEIATVLTQSTVNPVSGVPVAVLTPTPSANNTLADLAAVALSEATSLRGTSLTVTVQDGRAVLTGQVATHLQRKGAEVVLTTLDGIKTADIEKVVVTARTRGARHTVASGDTLSKLAYDYYGDASLTQNILSGNRKTLKGRNNLAIGMDLAIPSVD
jgi:LysM repeat protein